MPKIYEIITKPFIQYFFLVNYIFYSFAFVDTVILVVIIYNLLFRTDNHPSTNGSINRIVEDEIIISPGPTNNFTLTELGTVDLR